MVLRYYNLNRIALVIKLLYKNRYKRNIHCTHYEVKWMEYDYT
jgi:hypothetical protein